MLIKNKYLLGRAKDSLFVLAGIDEILYIFFVLLLGVDRGS